MWGYDGAIDPIHILFPYDAVRQGFPHIYTTKLPSYQVTSHPKDRDWELGIVLSGMGTEPPEPEPETEPDDEAVVGVKIAQCTATIQAIRRRLEKGASLGPLEWRSFVRQQETMVAVWTAEFADLKACFEYFKLNTLSGLRLVRGAPAVAAPDWIRPLDSAR